MKNNLRDSRFAIFRHALREQLGYRADLLADDSILINSSTFSPAQRFNTLQGAIDHFARFMPDSLNEGTERHAETQRARAEHDRAKIELLTGA